MFTDPAKIRATDLGHPEGCVVFAFHKLYNPLWAAREEECRGGKIGCVACKPVQALINWVRRGFTPTNLALWRKADPTLCVTLGISATCTPGAVQMDPNQLKMGWAY